VENNVNKKYFHHFYKDYVVLLLLFEFYANAL